MWNNPYLSSKKIAKYLHEPNIVYDVGSPSDSQKLHQGKEEQDKIRRSIHLYNRQNQKNRLKARKIEREVLQCASLQNLHVEPNRKLAETIYTSNSDLALDCQQRKSTSFKDPSKRFLGHSV